MTTIEDQALDVLKQLDESPGRRLRTVDGFVLMIEPGEKHRGTIANGSQIFQWLKDRLYIRPQHVGGSFIFPDDTSFETWQISLNGISTCAEIRKEATKITPPRKVALPPKIPKPKPKRRPAKRQKVFGPMPGAEDKPRRPEPPSVRQEPEPVQIPHRRGRPVAISRCPHGVDGGCPTCREIEGHAASFGRRARQSLGDQRT